MARKVHRSAATGRFVSEATARKEPRTTVLETVGVGGTRPVNRSAVSGRFVTPEFVKQHPDTTITQKV